MLDGTFHILIDGDCPLCCREAAILRRLDRGRSRLLIVDIADPAFDASVYGLTQDEAMGRIHGMHPGGRVVAGMEVFRTAYGAVGRGWLLAPTGWPVLRPIFDRLYRWFARNRLRLTRRGAACGSGACGSGASARR